MTASHVIAVTVAAIAALLIGALATAVYLLYRRLRNTQALSPNSMQLTLLRTSTPKAGSHEASFELDKQKQPIVLGQGTYGKV